MNSAVERSAGAQTSRSDLGHQAHVSPKHSTAFVLAIFLSWLGVGRFYMGRKDIGTLQLLAFAATVALVIILADSDAAVNLISTPLTIWLLIDQILIGSGKARDGKGNPLIIFGDDAPRNYRQVHVSEKHTPAVILSGIWVTNMLGIDRMYMGRVGLGIVKLITLGGLFVWIIVDYILIGRGKARDGKGRPLIVR